MIRSICAAVLVLGCGLAVADTLAERWSKRIESADAIYQAAIQKADNTRQVAVQKATFDRVRVLKSAISDATKAGDFTAAMELQSRLEAAESGGIVRPKPKNTVKFNGHEYLLIQDKASWHVAKRLCEQMGGRLAVIDSPQKQAFVVNICKALGEPVWLGAVNEDDDWNWVTGSKVTSTSGWTINEGPLNSVGLTWQPATGLDDHGVGTKMTYVCEWEK